MLHKYCYTSLPAEEIATTSGLLIHHYFYLDLSVEQTDIIISNVPQST